MQLSAITAVKNLKNWLMCFPKTIQNRLYVDKGIFMGVHPTTLQTTTKKSITPAIEIPRFDIVTVLVGGRIHHLKDVIGSG
jgi:hypothetical protein